MSDDVVLIGTFRDVDPVVEALDRLRALGIADDDLSVLSSLPYSHEMLGRPKIGGRLPLISILSALGGAVAGVFFVLITPHLYVIRVGGQAIIPGPPTAVLMYEFIMLFLILGTFVASLRLGGLFSYQPGYYDPAISQGRIGLLCRCPAAQEEAARGVLEAQGAEAVREAERRAL